MLKKLFPKWTLEREKARLQMQLIDYQSKAMESLPTFAQDRDESGWVGLTPDKQIYTEQEVDDMQAQALKMSRSAQGENVIGTMESFVIGKRAEMTAIGLDDEKKLEAIQDYWKGFTKAEEWDKKSKELLTRTVRDGESFLRFFEPPISDVGGKDFQQIRFVEPREIKDRAGNYSYGIETEVEDVETVVNYHRIYQKKIDTRDIANIEGTEVIPADEIIHTKIRVDSNVKRGISFLVGVAEWMTVYENWLKDRVNLNKLRNIFNLVAKVEGAGNITDLKNQFSDVVGKTSTGSTTKKKMPASGTMLWTRGTDFEFKNLNIKAQDTKDDGRSIQLMVGLGLQFPEYIVRADASNSNMASHMVSESPFVRMIEKYQDIFQEPFKKTFFKVVRFGVSSGKIDNVTEADLEELECQVDFATIIHREIKTETEAAVMHKDIGLASTRTLSAQFGYSYEDEQEQIKKENDEIDSRELDRERTLNQNPRNKPNPNKEN